ncbi:9203_t:CDS:2, partial [Racocetra persica]
VIIGQKSAGEKFAGALETYTVECLLPDGQCLQLATSHYFGDNFCRLMEVKFQNKDNKMEHPFSTSWGTSTRVIGLILPFEIAPVQIAFILIGESSELINYYQEIYGLLSRHYRCQLYNKNEQVNANVIQADQEGCPFKMIIGKHELEHQEITLIRRDNVERKITIKLEENETEKKYITAAEKYWEEISGIDQKNKEVLIKEKTKMTNSFRQGQRAGKIFGTIGKETVELQKNLYQKSAEFRDKHIFSVASLTELEKKIKGGSKGLFLVPFCNNLDCELKIKEKVPSYSIRCIAGEKKVDTSHKCLFCQSAAQNRISSSKKSSGRMKSIRVSSGTNQSEIKKAYNNLIKKWAEDKWKVRATERGYPCSDGKCGVVPRDGGEKWFHSKKCKEIFEKVISNRKLIDEAYTFLTGNAGKGSQNPGGGGGQQPPPEEECSRCGKNYDFATRFEKFKGEGNKNPEKPENNSETQQTNGPTSENGEEEGNETNDSDLDDHSGSNSDNSSDSNSDQDGKSDNNPPKNIQEIANLPLLQAQA